jgi:hypothetical protein
MATVLQLAFEHDCLPSLEEGFAQEWADYKQALARVIAMDPDRFAHVPGMPLGPLVALDEAAVAMANAAWVAGARVGDAFARAERSFQSGYRICPRCHGQGVRDGDGDGDGSGTCFDCRGRRVVPADDESNA